MLDGVGPDAFDCSGLIIKSHSDVMGRDVSDWPLTLRHVRDMWRAAKNQDHGLATTGLVVGSLLVTARYYEIGGEEQVVAGHIGIVTTIMGEEVQFIHASPAAGMVEERPFTTLSTVMGTVSLAGV